MTTRRTSLQIVFLLATISLLFALPAFQVAGQTSRYTVSGYVLDTNGRGVMGAIVNIYASTVGQNAITDSAGHYAVSALAGTYVLTVYPPQDSNVINYQENGVNVASAIVKNVTVAYGYKISGYVLNSKWNVIPGASVSLVAANGTTYQSSFSSDSTGYYFVSAPKGTYTLNLYPPANSGYSGYSEPNFVVSGDNPYKNIVIAQGAKVSGYMTDSSGKPIANVYVVLNSYLVRGAYSDNAGYYEVYAPPGSYVFTANAPENSSYINYSDNSFNVAASNVVKNVTLATGFKISGYVFDSNGAPVSRATISLSGTSYYFSAYYSTYQGYYSIAAPAGTYTFSINPPTGTQITRYYEYNFVVSGDATKNVTMRSPPPPPTPTPVPTPTPTPSPTSVPTPTPTPTSTPTSPPQYLTSGYILDSKGKGIAGATVIFNEPTIAPSVKSDATGYYAISAPAGTYHMDVWPPFDSYYINYDETGLQVNSNLNKNVTLPTGCKVSGYILDASGKPVQGINVFLNNSISSGWASGADGYYFLCAPTGTYTLYAKLISLTSINYIEYNLNINGNTTKNITLSAPSPTPTPIATPTPAPTPTRTPSPTPTPTQTPSPMPTPTLSPTQTPSPTPTPSPVPTPTQAPSPTPTPTSTPTPTPSPSTTTPPAPTPTPSPTQTAAPFYTPQGGGTPSTGGPSFPVAAALAVAIAVVCIAVVALVLVSLRGGKQVRKT